MIDAASTVEGFVERVARRTVFGWARDRSRPDAPVIVSVIVNGIAAGTATASVFRPDLTAAGYGGHHGFEFPVVDELDEVDDVEVRVNGAAGQVLDLASDFTIDHATNRPTPRQAVRLLPLEWTPGQACAFPSFFVLGAAKCGTTALHYYLRQHPDLCMSIPKEPYYFEAEYEHGPEHYFNQYFIHWQGEPFAGESRHRNLYLPFVAPRIHAHNPAAKLIVILREPVERLVSDWWHWHSRGLDPLSLEDAVAEDLQRLAAGRTYGGQHGEVLYRRTLSSHGTSLFRTYVDAGYYAEQLERYLALFPRESLHIVWHDQLRDSPVAAMEALLRFLGADPVPAPRLDYTRLNQGKPGARTQVTGAMVRFLTDHFRPHNRALERLCGRLLPAWDEPSVRTGRSAARA